MATPRRLKGMAVYWVLRTVAGFVGLLPERLAVWLGELGGSIVWRFAGDRRDMAIRHMSRLGGADSAERMARGMFVSYGRYWGEALWIRPRKAARVMERVSVEGLDRLLAARDAGKGMIFALPHIGNWEVAGTITRREGVELMAAAERLGNQRLVDWFTKLRAMLGIQIVLADGGREVFRALYRVIERGGAAALLTDRDISGSGVEVSFFGEMTTLPKGAISIAIRSGAPVFPAASYFKPGLGHHLVVEPPLTIPTEGSLEERVLAGTTELAAALERLIRRAPEQWHLLQPNWPSDRGPR